MRCALMANSNYWDVSVNHMVQALQVGIVTTRRWILVWPRIHLSYQIGVSLGRSSVSSSRNGVKTLSLLAGRAFWYWFWERILLVEVDGLRGVSYMKSRQLVDMSGSVEAWCFSGVDFLFAYLDNFVKKSLLDERSLPLEVCSKNAW